jgi:hypothetical protein
VLLSIRFGGFSKSYHFLVSPENSGMPVTIASICLVLNASAFKKYNRLSVPIVPLPCVSSALQPPRANLHAPTKSARGLCIFNSLLQITPVVPLLCKNDSFCDLQ